LTNSSPTSSIALGGAEEAESSGATIDWPSTIAARAGPNVSGSAASMMAGASTAVSNNGPANGPRPSSVYTAPASTAEAPAPP
jgi:hypothetical protein